MARSKPTTRTSDVALLRLCTWFFRRHFCHFHGGRRRFTGSCYRRSCYRRSCYCRRTTTVGIEFVDARLTAVVVEACAGGTRTIPHCAVDAVVESFAAVGISDLLVFTREVCDRSAGTYRRRQPTAASIPEGGSS